MATVEHSQQIPRLREALIVKGPGRLEVASVPMPAALGPGQVLVRVACVALNPSDAKVVEAGKARGSVAGFDFAGTVVCLGPDCCSTDITVGTRVCGVAFGYNNDNNAGTGAFADYAVTEAHLLVPVPGGMSLQDAATLPVGLLTGGMVLFHVLKLRERPPPDGSKQVLVYGGSTTSGLVMIQLLQHAGFQPIATCSPRNFDLVKGAGAVAAYDYRSESCTKDIREDTGDGLVLAVDCITSPESMRICYAALRSSPDAVGGGAAAGGDWPRYVALETIPTAGHTRRAVRPSWVFAMSAFGVAVNLQGGHSCEESPEDRAFAERWMRVEATSLLGSGAVKPPRSRVVGRSLAAVAGGLRMLREEGRVSGEKLVCVLTA